jgi:hypothetical protein
MKNTWKLFIALLACAALVAGCSFSTSSKHSSKSSSSPSRSSSKGGEESVNKNTVSLKEEVEALTILYVGSSGSAVDFQREISQISKGHGTVDWENNPHIFSAIGVGLNRAGVAKETVKSLPFLQGLDTSLHYPMIIAEFK